MAVSDLDGGAAQSAAAAIGRAGGTAVSTACDVTSEEDRAALITTAVQALGAPTILINNAGGGGPQPFDMPLEKFEWAFKLNVFSSFRLCQLSRRTWRRRATAPSSTSARWRARTRATA